MFRSQLDKTALNYILDKKNVFNESNKKNFYDAFDQLFAKRIKYRDLLDLNNDDARLLENRNALTAYCHYIIYRGERVAGQYRLIMAKNFLGERTATAIAADGRIRPLISQSWTVPEVDTFSILNATDKKSDESVVILSSGKVAALSDLKFTILDPKVAYRDAKELHALCAATGAPPKNLVAFKPARLALHEIIVAIVTQVQCVPENKTEEALEHDAIFLRITKLVLDRARMEIETLSIQLHAERTEIYSACIRVIVNNEKLGESKISEADISRTIASAKAQIKLSESSIEYKTILVALATDLLYTEKATEYCKTLANRHINEMIMMGKLIPLIPPTPKDRKTFFVAGGQASGKGSAYAILKYSAELAGISWCNLSKGGVDTFRPLLLDSDSVLPELYALLTLDEAVLVNHTKVYNELCRLANAGRAPNIFIDQTSVAADKLRLGLQQDGEVFVVVSTKVESSIERSFLRGVKIGRYENPQNILRVHREMTEALPERIKEFAGKKVAIRIIDNNVPMGSQAVAVADIDCFNKTIEIYDYALFLEFIKKTTINCEEFKKPSYAKSINHLYDTEKVSRLRVEDYLKSVLVPEVGFVIKIVAPRRTIGLSP